MNHKNIFITGASSGFGKLTIPLLLQRGHCIIAGLRGGEIRLNSMFSEEIRHFPGRLHAVELHLEQPQAPELARGKVEEVFGGKLDVLVNNAGYGLFGALEDLTPELLRHQMEVNFFAPAFLTRTLLPALKLARGRVLMVSSVVGRIALPLYGAYCASKFALEGFSEALSHDLKAQGIQVCLVEPGGFRTDFSTRSKNMILTSGSQYASQLAALKSFFENRNHTFGDPIYVAKKMVRLCEKRRIQLRYPVGTDAWLAVLLSKILPDSWRTQLIGGFFSRFVLSKKET